MGALSHKFPTWWCSVVKWGFLLTQSALVWSWRGRKWTFLTLTPAFPDFGKFDLCRRDRSIWGLSNGGLRPLCATRAPSPALAHICGLLGPSVKLECRKWGFKRWGFKEIRGYLRKKAFFLRFLDFPGALRTLRKRVKKAEKGRKRPISADFLEGRPDTP